MNNRRDFLKKMAGLTASLMLPVQGCRNSFTNNDSLGYVLPYRKLGKTGEKVTMLGLGGYHIGWTTERLAQETIEAAIEGGIRFFDTAESYGPHISEERYGKYLVPKYRDHVFIMTKTTARTAKTVKEHLEASLKRLKTDHLDLWQVHSLENPEDVDNRIKDDVLKVFMEAKETGKTRYIGFTGHANPHAHNQMLEQVKDHDIFDTCQMPISPLDAAYHTSFVNLVMPTLVKREYGILAMKTLAAGRFFSNTVIKEEQIWQTDDPVIPGRITLSDAIHFAFTMPISVLITGAEKPEFLLDKISLAKNFVNQSREERIKLIDRVADLSAKGKVEYYKAV